MAFVRLRGAVYAEGGFCVDVNEIAPDGLRKEMSAYFSVLDRDKKTIQLEPICGCEGGGDDDRVINVPLHQYDDPATAKKCLFIMLACLPEALKNRHNEKILMGEAWLLLTVKGCGLAYQDSAAQAGLLENLFGKGRYMEHMNMHGTIARLAEKYDPARMVNEALRL